MAKKLNITYDKIGQEVKVGSLVVAPDTKTQLFIGKVESISPKQLKLRNVEKNWTSYKYHSEVLCIDGLEGTVMFLLASNL